MYSRHEHGQAIKKEYGSFAWACKDGTRKTRTRARAETERNVGSKKKAEQTCVGTLVADVRSQKMVLLDEWSRQCNTEDEG